MSLHLAGHTDVGPESDENQDAWLARPMTPGGHLLVVCDGMGGMGRGAEAARVAVDHLEALLLGGATHSAIRAALSATDQHLRTRLVDPGPGRPGCTAVVVGVLDGRAWVGWAGDARAYHVRQGRVLARTRDHKLVEDLIEAGHLDRGSAGRSSMAHVVTRALGGRRSDEPPHEPEVLHAPWHLEPGDALVLCSDGLSDVVSDVEVGIRVADRTAEQAARALVESALTAGTHDNTTVIVAIWDAERAASAGPDTPTAPSQRAYDPRALRDAGVPGPPPDPLLEPVDDPTTQPATATPDVAPPPSPAPDPVRTPRWVWLVAAGVALMLGLTLVAWALTLGGDGEVPPSAPAEVVE